MSHYNETESTNPHPSPHMHQALAFTELSITFAMLALSSPYPCLELKRNHQPDQKQTDKKQTDKKQTEKAN